MKHDAFMSVLDTGKPEHKHHIKRSETETALAIQAVHESNKHSPDPRRHDHHVHDAHAHGPQYGPAEFDEWMRWDLKQYVHLGTRKSHWDWGDWDWDEYDVTLHTKADIKSWPSGAMDVMAKFADVYLRKHGILEHADNVCTLSNNTNTRALIGFHRTHQFLSEVKEIPVEKINRAGNFVALPAMHVACKQKDEFMMDWFMKYGVKPQTRYSQWTAMYWACRNGELAVCRWLYSHGCAKDVRSSNKAGWTPMLAACAFGHPFIAQWLYRHGAAEDAMLANNKGETPFMLAVVNGHHGVSAWLKDLGAHEDDDASIDNDIGIDPAWAVMGDVEVHNTVLKDQTDEEILALATPTKAWVKGIDGKTTWRTLPTEKKSPHHWTAASATKIWYVPSNLKSRKKPAWGRPKTSPSHHKERVKTSDVGDTDVRNARRPYSAPANLRRRRRSRDDMLGDADGHVDSAHAGGEFQHAQPPAIDGVQDMARMLSEQVSVRANDRIKFLTKEQKALREWKKFVSNGEPTLVKRKAKRLGFSAQIGPVPVAKGSFDSNGSSITLSTKKKKKKKKKLNANPGEATEAWKRTLRAY